MVAVNAVARFTVQSLWFRKLQNCPPAIDFETNWERKIIKRDGDKLGFPVFPLEWETEEELGYREGILSEAVVNFLALWVGMTERRKILWKNWLKLLI
jgi:hypothetical protein